MKSRATKSFWQAFFQLPKDIRKRARQAYRQFKKDPRHPSLRLKRIRMKTPVYSVRISTNYRAVGKFEADENAIVWFWIGSHADYDKLLSQM